MGLTAAVIQDVDTLLPHTLSMSELTDAFVGFSTDVADELGLPCALKVGAVASGVTRRVHAEGIVLTLWTDCVCAREGGREREL